MEGVRQHLSEELSGLKWSGHLTIGVIIKLYDFPGPILGIEGRTHQGSARTIA